MRPSPRASPRPRARSSRSSASVAATAWRSSSTNHPDYLVLLYACARLGALLVPLNWRLAVPEQVFILSDASVKALVVEESLRRRESRRLRRRCPTRASSGSTSRPPVDARSRHMLEAGKRRRPRLACRHVLAAARGLHVGHHRPAEGRGAAPGGAAVERRHEPAHARHHRGRPCAHRAAHVPRRRAQYPDHACAAARRDGDDPCRVSRPTRRSTRSSATIRP